MQNKTRAHRVLFDTNLPFKSKVERDRKKFNRKEKHRNKGWE